MKPATRTPQGRHGKTAGEPPRPCAQTRPGKWLIAACCLLTLLLLTSLFKNISYPLLWADESMTAMGGVRVLQFGYPKVHDGRNVFYDLRHPDRSLGIHEGTDAFIGGASWGMYYVAALGVKLASLTEDLYLRTGILRTLFALFGLAGLCLWGAMGARLFGSARSKLALLACLAVLSLLSVSLALHLREVRYYPLAVFLTAAASYLYCSRQEMGVGRYAALQTVALVLLYTVFAPAYFALATAVAACEGARLLSARRGTPGGCPAMPAPGGWARQALPLGLSFAAVCPLLLFFETFHISGELGRHYAAQEQTSALALYFNNLALAWRYFASFELLYLALFLKACRLGLRWTGRTAADRDSGQGLKASCCQYLTLLFTAYVFLVATIPNPLFTRYLVPMQPVLALVILLDGAIVHGLLQRGGFGAAGRRLLAPACALFVCWNAAANVEHLSGHARELFQRYEGPLDYIIPYLKRQFPDTRNLVIATNYEETSFMYYLDARVVIGFVGYNLEQDEGASPDAIVYRRYWGRYARQFQSFLERGNYEQIDFPVADYPFNNIPELNWAPPIRHLFRTLAPQGQVPPAMLFLKEGAKGSGRAIPAAGVS